MVSGSAGSAAFLDLRAPPPDSEAAGRPSAGTASAASASARTARSASARERGSATSDPLDSDGDCGLEFAAPSGNATDPTSGFPDCEISVMSGAPAPDITEMAGGTAEAPLEEEETAEAPSGRTAEAPSEETTEAPG